MRAIWTQMRKDCQELRWWLTVWLLGVLLAIGWARFAYVVETWSLPTASGATPFVSFLLLVTSFWPALMVAKLFTLDPPTGPRAIWRALPFRPIGLLSAKTCLGLAIVLPGLIGIDLFLARDILAVNPTAAVAIALGAGILGIQIVALGTLAGAMSSGRLSIAAIVLFGTFVAKGLFVSSVRGPDAEQYSVWDANVVSQTIVLAVLLSLVALATVWIFYRWRRRTLAVVALVLGVVATGAVVTRWSWNLLPSIQRTSPPARADLANLTLTPLDSACEVEQDWIVGEWPAWLVRLDLDLPEGVDGIEFTRFQVSGTIAGVTVECRPEFDLRRWSRDPDRRQQPSSLLAFDPGALSESLGARLHQDSKTILSNYLSCRPPANGWDAARIESRYEATDEVRRIDQRFELQVSADFRTFRFGKSHVLAADTLAPQSVGWGTAEPIVGAKTNSRQQTELYFRHRTESLASALQAELFETALFFVRHRDDDRLLRAELNGAPLQELTHEVLSVNKVRGALHWLGFRTLLLRRATSRPFASRTGLDVIVVERSLGEQQLNAVKQVLSSDEPPVLLHEDDVTDCSQSPTAQGPRTTTDPQR